MQYVIQAKLNLQNKKFEFLTLCLLSGYTHEFHQIFHPIIGPAVWPAIAYIYVYINITININTYF